jgi:hypothetical protein
MMDVVEDHQPTLKRLKRQTYSKANLKLLLTSSLCLLYQELPERTAPIEPDNAEERTKREFSGENNRGRENSIFEISHGSSLIEF